MATPTSYPLRKSDADLMAHAMNTKFYKEKKTFCSGAYRSEAALCLIESFLQVCFRKPVNSSKRTLSGLDLKKKSPVAMVHKFQN
jgi:hypothetical protein